MRVVGLISGGKDSIFNIMQCISAGHNVVALANITPDPLTNKDELDSYMFQTVGHEGIDVIAEVTGLPLYKQRTLGISNCQNLSYQPTTEDEVEDLFELLRRVKEDTACNGVAVGAIASDYQRYRVENVCSRLGLTSLCYLWHQNQSDLLRSMINAGVNAITVKVAAMGLTPSQHLGKSLQELEQTLTCLQDKFGVNVCGEGGEYETFVLDCPLFHKKILINKTEVIHDSYSAIAASGHLILKSLKTESKYGEDSIEETQELRLNLVRNQVLGPNQYVQECCKNISQNDPSYVEENTVEQFNTSTEISPLKWFYVHHIAASDIKSAIDRAAGELAKHNMLLNDVIFVNLWLRDMADFSLVNQEYVKCLPEVAPARACVATSLPEASPILMELVACRQSSDTRSVIHVQSISHWAPANIGPYSQSVKNNGLIFVAGQIPLIPGSMALLVGPLDYQLRLCLRHVERILKASGANLNHIIHVTVFVSNQKYTSESVTKLRWILPNQNTVINAIAVKTLPREADVEIIAVATENEIGLSTAQELILDGFQCSLNICHSKSIVAVSCKVQCQEREKASKDGIAKILLTLLKYSKYECGLKIMYGSGDLGMESMILDAVQGITVTAVPVLQNEHETLFTIIGIGFDNKTL